MLTNHSKPITRRGVTAFLLISFTGTWLWLLFARVGLGLSALHPLLQLPSFCMPGIHERQRPVLGDVGKEVGPVYELNSQSRAFRTCVRGHERRDGWPVDRLEAVHFEEEPGPAVLVEHRWLDHLHPRSAGPR